MHGYMGKLLIVDLSDGAITAKSLNEEYVRRYVGGSGLACRYLYDMISAETDPLGAENPLIFMAGPLVGTAAPSCGRFTVSARSPLTGLWGESNAGGFWGPELRFAGYDGLIIRGKASAPVYLRIVDDDVRLVEADHIWGLSTYETRDRIKAESGGKRTRVACIGPAAENGVLYAGIMNAHGRMNGRSGLGTVMGSKNLKAVAVLGSQRVPLADEVTFKAIARDTRGFLSDDMSTLILNATGTSGNMDYFMLLGCTPVRYFTQGEFPASSALSGAVMAETILTGTSTCYGCPVACGRTIEITEGKYATPETDGPEYESICALGTVLLIDNLEAVSHMDYLCDSAGMDTIDMGMVIGLATYLYDQGSISSRDTGGIELRWGDPDLAIRLIEMTIRREGFGELLAQGSLRLARHFGVEELAVQVNGQALAMHDPRGMSAMGLVYATSPRGACHNQSDMYWVDMGRPIAALGIPTTDRFGIEGKAAITARHQDWRSLGNALIQCTLPNPPVQNVIGMLAAATGWDLDNEKALWLGEGIWNIKRALNLRLGWNRAREKLPNLVMQPLAEGGTEGNVPDMEILLRDYYHHRGWDMRTGKPERQRLEALGMEDIAADLYG